MNKQAQSTYAYMIHVLFNGSVKAHPSQITPEIVDMTNQMFTEIATCHERIRPLAILIDGIAGSVMKLLPPEVLGVVSWLPGAYDMSLTEYLQSRGRDSFFSGLNTLMDIYKTKPIDASKANNAAKVLEAFVESWFKYTEKDRKLKMCIVTAQARWRSKFEIGLLGL